MNAIRCQGLSKTFKDIHALTDLNLEIPEGAIYGMLGPNGAGKSTAIKTLMNILRPTSGHAEVLGCDSRELGAKEFERIGYVSENMTMPDWMTVEQFMAYLKPFYSKWDDERAAELLKQFELPPKRKLKQLSRGMWMKASLASSLAYRPSLLVMDEPFSGLDPVVRDDLIQGIIESADETTILVSSHDLAEIETLATHIGYMESGRLVFSEDMESLVGRFREVDVTVDQPVQIPKEWPRHWMRPEVSPALVRFVDSNYHPERTADELRSLFAGVVEVSAAPMPLRTIFLTMARYGGKR